MSSSYDANAPGTFDTTTKSCLVQVPGDANFVRLVFSNTTAAAYTLQAYVAPTCQVGNGWSAYDPAGSADTSLFASVTFNNAGADKSPDDNPGTVTPTATIPANTTAYYSDWIPLRTRPRTDSPDGGRLLLVRSQAPTGTPSGLATPAHPGGITTDIAATGGVSACFGSNTGINSLTAGDFRPDKYSHLLELQFYSIAGGYTILYCGTSIILGATTTNNRNPFVRIAAKALTTQTGAAFATVCNVVNGALTMAHWAPRALININRVNPDFTLIQVTSRNDPITAAQQDIVWRSVEEIADRAIRNGGIPILVTATPWPPGHAPTAIEDGYRQINNNRARASGLPCFDYDALLSDGGSPARLLPIYNDCGDQAHPGNTGHAYAATVFEGFLRRLVLT